MRILVFTTDVIPLAGLATSGTALRTFGLIQGLRAHGHEVLVSVPKTALSGLLKTAARSDLDPPVRREIDELTALSFDSFNQPQVLARTNPEVVICGHWPALTLRYKPSQLLILDLAGPHLLERHFQALPDWRGALNAKLSVLATADYYIVSGPSQRLYFLSFLLRTAVPDAERKIITITMPLDPKMPEPQRDPARYPRFVFGGVFLPWQNPAAGLKRVAAELEMRRTGELALIGGAHPNYPISEGLYGELFRSLSANPFVTVKSMLPYRSFLDELMSADVAVDLMHWNLERQLAITIRTTTYLWSGLPVIYNDYADLGRLINAYDAGWCLDPEDANALGSVLEQIFCDPNTVRNKSENARRLSREVFAWDRAVAPLLDLLGRSGRSLRRECDIVFDFPDSADFPILPGKSIEQYFLCRVGGLSRVECRIATHGRELEQPLTVSVREVGDWRAENLLCKSAGNGRLVVRKTIEPAAVRNNEWLAVDFEPEIDSAGKAFALSLETVTGNSLSESACSPWAVKDSPFPLLGLRYGEKVLPHTAMCLKTTCTGGA